MLKALLAAILVALVVVILLLLPIVRPDRGPVGPVAVNSPSAPPPSSFVIHNDAPPAQTAAPTSPGGPGSAAGPASNPDSLDAVMQRLRSGKPGATFVVTPAAPSGAGPATPTPASPTPASATPVAPAPASPLAPAVPALAPASPPPAPAPASAQARWTSVTGQGVQYRTGRAGDGYVISIDLGGGQVADVHVLPAFGRLDQTAVNTRVDYLKQTILENFSTDSATYSFNRDGSVSRGR